MWKNQRGFNLVELLIGLGIGSVVLYATANLSQMAGGSQKRTALNLNFSQIHQEISGILANPTNCTATVTNAPLPSSGGLIDGIYQRSGATNVRAFATGNPSQSADPSAQAKKVHISEIAFIPIVGKEGLIRLSIKREENPQTDFLTLDFPVSFETDANNILTSCTFSNQDLLNFARGAGAFYDPALGSYRFIGYVSNNTPGLNLTCPYGEVLGRVDWDIVNSTVSFECKKNITNGGCPDGEFLSGIQDGEIQCRTLAPQDIPALVDNSVTATLAGTCNVSLYINADKVGIKCD
jgi:prepilin-type N-terminal cleavage/methylation domain-containing protein